MGRKRRGVEGACSLSASLRGATRRGNPGSVLIHTFLDCFTAFAMTHFPSTVAPWLNHGVQEYQGRRCFLGSGDLSFVAWA